MTYLTSKCMIDMKLISKVLASLLKSVISTIVNENQDAYVNNRFIGL